eukprot:9571354-Alexandrium_andersonii.AAC.1
MQGRGVLRCDGRRPTTVPREESCAWRLMAPRGGSGRSSRKPSPSPRAPPFVSRAGSLSTPNTQVRRASASPTFSTSLSRHCPRQLQRFRTLL